MLEQEIEPTNAGVACLIREVADNINNAFMPLVTTTEIGKTRVVQEKLIGILGALEAVEAYLNAVACEIEKSGE